MPSQRSFKIIVVGIVLQLVVIAGCNQNSPTAANVVMRDPGIYHAPVGDASVRITDEGNGLLNFAFQSRSVAAKPADPFSSADPWLLAWDKQGRLWSYTQRDGVQCFQNNADGHGILRPGEHGGWDDVPTQFIANLPERARAQYENDVQKASKTPFL